MKYVKLELQATIFENDDGTMLVRFVKPDAKQTIYATLTVDHKIEGDLSERCVVGMLSNRSTRAVEAFEIRNPDGFDEFFKGVVKLFNEGGS